ncbi:MAG TPA: hypothetical protein VF229_03330 [Burkholderiaceae bacterium]
MKIKVLFSCAALALPLLAIADESAPASVGIGFNGGLSGAGADLTVRMSNYFNVRAMAAGLTVTRDGNYGTSDSWSAKLKLFQAGALLDYFPFAGGFHLTAGAVYDGNKIDAQPNGGTLTFNGTTYQISQLGSAGGTVEWNKVVPYLGIGAGNGVGSRGLHVTADAGVLFTGSPTSTLSATCGAAAIALDPTCQSTLNANVQVEQNKLRDNTGNLKYWPVARIGINSAF